MASSRCARTPRAQDAYEIKAAAGGKFHFVLKASNGQVIGTSQLYVSEASAKAGTEPVRNNAPGASVQDDA